MRPASNLSRLIAAHFFVLFISIFSYAQLGGSGGAPPSIQFFMPDGSLPPREIRFTLSGDNGRIETLFSDSKGRFLMSRSLGLKTDAEYRLFVQGDGRTFDSTSLTFKEFGVYYIPIFLRPLNSPSVKRVGMIDIAEFDTLAPQEARQAYTTALRSYRAGQPDEAVRGLERAVSIYPEYFRALNDLGVLYMKLNRLEKAGQMFERAIKIGPRVYYPRLNLAIIKTRLGKYKESVAMLEQLYKENPTLSEARIALGDALLALNRLDDAEVHLRAALTDTRLDRAQSGDAHYRLGLLLNRKQQFEDAIKELTIASEAIPRSPRIHLQLGGALLQVKRMDEAERELLEAYRIGGPQMGGAQLMLGQIYFLDKKFEQALHAFEQYLADVPKAPNEAEIQGVIKKIKTALNKD